MSRLEKQKHGSFVLKPSSSFARQIVHITCLLMLLPSMCFSQATEGTRFCFDTREGECEFECEDECENECKDECEGECECEDECEGECEGECEDECEDAYVCMRSRIVIRFLFVPVKQEFQFIISHCFFSHSTDK